MVNKENEYDVIVIGGGATGAGTARDCALRGLFTLGVNYYVTDNIVARLNYSYQKLNQEYTKEFMLDKNLHSIQARVAFEF